MKTFLVLSILFSSIAMAANSQDCLKETDSIDRKYCMDKYMAGIKKQQDAEKKEWSKGVTPETKTQKSELLAQEIANKKDYINLLTQEMAATEKHLQDLQAATEKTPSVAAPKKKKKKSGFRIKL
jgi:uncharacterized protein YeaO (DUF488 family)